MSKYLIKDDGYIYPYTEVLAKRKDMRPYDGPLPGVTEAKKDDVEKAIDSDAEDSVGVEDATREELMAFLEEKGEKFRKNASTESLREKVAELTEGE